eukprot:g1458.t1
MRFREHGFFLNELTDAALSDGTDGNADALAGTILVSFYSPHCGHCKAFHPAFAEVGEALAATEAVGVRAAAVDATESRGFASFYGVKRFPTILLLKDGIKQAQYKGPRSTDDLLAFVEGFSDAPATLSLPLWRRIKALGLRWLILRPSLYVLDQFDDGQGMSPTRLVVLGTVVLFLVANIMLGLCATALWICCPCFRKVFHVLTPPPEIAAEIAAYKAAKAAGAERMSVTVPAGASPGKAIQVQTPRGLMSVTVPAGVGPGQQFLIQLPPAPSDSSCTGSSGGGDSAGKSHAEAGPASTDESSSSSSSFSSTKKDQ